MVGVGLLKSMITIVFPNPPERDYVLGATSGTAPCPPAGVAQRIPGDGRAS